MADNKNIVNFFLKKGFLISPDFIDEVSENFNSKIFSNLEKRPIILSSDLKGLINKETINFNWSEYERGKVSFEKNRENDYYKSFIKMASSENFIDKKDFYKVIEETKKFNGGVVVLKDYKERFKKREIGDFISYFRNRFEGIKKILVNRTELQNLISINKLKYQQEGKQVAIMGLVYDKGETKTGNIVLELEDTTGSVKLMISKNKKEVYSSAKDIVLDEVVGVVGVSKGGFLFIDDLIFPEIPSNNEIKKSPGEVYTVFISDIHFGLNKFLEKDFNRFIGWLNGSYGDEKQREISSKVGYLFIVGDLVEGVGIYPNQEKDLAIEDIYKQYEYAASFLSRIPERIKIIICTGNHDAVRMSEPQPSFDIRFAKPLFDLKNTFLVTNPSLIKIHASEDFPGFNVLLYHGFSIPYYSENVESIHLGGGLDRTDLIMKFFLQRRHLAPAYGSTLSIPDAYEDSLVIDVVPDIFVTGHVHKVKVSNYKNVICINASCWVTQTEDQERRGIFPEPSRAIVINLKTRDIKVMNFGK